MKRKTPRTIILFSLVLASCLSVPPFSPTNTSNLTVVLTPTSVPATSMPKIAAIVTQATSAPFINEKASNDCFLNVDFIPGKTGMNEVISAWGNPSSIDSFGTDYEYWDFDLPGTPYIRFKSQVIDTVSFFLKNCSLEKIISKLGPPEEIEITMLFSDIDLWASYTQYFHYPSLGFAFYRLCDKAQNCFTFQADDIVIGKEFYAKDKVIEDTMGFNMSSYVYNWHGFGVDVEQVENKIDDFGMLTPTP